MTSGPVRGRGRRAGRPDTRTAILRAARAAFAQSGYAATSIRRIAADAGVDPALVHHYFGTKEKVLLAAVDIPISLRERVADVLDGPVETLGFRLVGVALAAWESPAGPALATALRLAISDPAWTRLIRGFLLAEILEPVLRRTGCPAAEVDIRAGLVAAQMLGLLVGRFLVAIEPLAATPTAVVAEAVGATVQRYLTGPLAPDDVILGGK